MNRKKRRKRAGKASMPAGLPGQGPCTQGAATPSSWSLAAALRSTPRPGGPPAPRGSPPQPSAVRLLPWAHTQPRSLH